MHQSYSDGFFNVSPTNGFLPVSAPLPKLPSRYLAVQAAIDTLPELILDIDKLNTTIKNLPEFDPATEANIFIIQALFRAYTFLSSAYLLAPSFHNQTNGTYGKALNVLPPNLAKPLVCVAFKLKVKPWLDYHYAYSLGNYVQIDPKQGLFWKNLRMACSFTGGPDETGFIMNHVYINEKSPDLVKAIYLYLDQQELQGMKLFYTTLVEINERRKTMWLASNHHNYNHFRAFIMGIKGNEEIFGPGVQYQIGEASDTEYRQYRGQTGAQDDIIPTCDIFTGVIEYYPQNQLTSYLMDLREYRPQCVQEFLKDLQTDMTAKSPRDYFKTKQTAGLVYLLAAIEQIYLFRNGHWQFVQKYIMANTKYKTATGGTPVISWLPNQIEACLQAMLVLIKELAATKLEAEENIIFTRIKLEFANKVKLLDQQLQELHKENFSVQRIYELNIENNLADI